jgi:hypothetical protein
MSATRPQGDIGAAIVDEQLASELFDDHVVLTGRKCLLALNHRSQCLRWLAVWRLVSEATIAAMFAHAR